MSVALPFPSARPSSPTGGNGIRLRRPAPPKADAVHFNGASDAVHFNGASDAAPLRKTGEALACEPTTGEFEGYASIFGLMDLGRDVVLPGAFRDSLSQRGPQGIRLLWQHDPAAPLGVWAQITEDARGLYVRGHLDLAQPKAREAFSLMQRGALDGLSIGYRTEIERRDPATGLRRLERIDLWEISLVTFPLHPQARVHGLRKTVPAARKGLVASPSPAFPGGCLSA